MAEPVFSFLGPVKAPNACPSCEHTPRMTMQCFGVRIECLDWRGRQVGCLCVDDTHFGPSHSGDGESR